jgi:hypothetical protein
LNNCWIPIPPIPFNSSTKFSHINMHAPATNENCITIKQILCTSIS